MHYLKIFATAGMMALAVSGLADTKTTRKSLKAREVTVLAPDLEPMTASGDSLLITGYDKPLRSTRETLFATNRHSTNLLAITLDIIYYDMDGSMLHSRRLTLACDIPPGETRQLKTVAWDRQQAYYFHGTRVTPRSEKAIAYRVDIRPINVIVQ
jgi:hypothetical protein